MCSSDLLSAFAARARWRTMQRQPSKASTETPPPMAKSPNDAVSAPLLSSSVPAPALIVDRGEGATGAMEGCGTGNMVGFRTGVALGTKDGVFDGLRVAGTADTVATISIEVTALFKADVKFESVSSENAATAKSVEEIDVVAESATTTSNPTLQV